MQEATVTINEGVDSLDDHISQLLSENSTRQFPHLHVDFFSLFVCVRTRPSARETGHVFSYPLTLLQNQAQHSTQFQFNLTEEQIFLQAV